MRVGLVPQGQREDQGKNALAPQITAPDGFRQPLNLLNMAYERPPGPQSVESDDCPRCPYCDNNHPQATALVFMGSSPVKVDCENCGWDFVVSQVGEARYKADRPEPTT